MNKNIKIMHGICLSVLIIFIGLIIFYYLKLTSGNDDGEMNETGLGVVLLIFIEGLIFLYTLIYGYFYLRLWKGKKDISFHRMNTKLTGYSALFILLLIIIYRRRILIFYFGPIILPLALLSYSSKIYIKKFEYDI